ncbi:MAG: hypothetical protein EOP49_20430 [Sphingobacteriales bacterium]|nr:MAG: hypothetical protein EOP49_20430 [Sphingobacteriales bacterium]
MPTNHQITRDQLRKMIEAFKMNPSGMIRKPDGTFESTIFAHIPIPALVNYLIDANLALNSGAKVTGSTTLDQLRDTQNNIFGIKAFLGQHAVKEDCPVKPDGKPDEDYLGRNTVVLMMTQWELDPNTNTEGWKEKWDNKKIEALVPGSTLEADKLTIVTNAFDRTELYPPGGSNYIDNTLPLTTDGHLAKGQLGKESSTNF